MGIWRSCRWLSLLTTLLNAVHLDLLLGTRWIFAHCTCLWALFSSLSSSRRPRFLYLALNQPDLTKHSRGTSQWMFVHPSGSVHLVANVFLNEGFILKALTFKYQLYLFMFIIQVEGKIAIKENLRNSQAGTEIHPRGVLVIVILLF